MYPSRPQITDSGDRTLGRRSANHEALTSYTFLPPKCSQHLAVGPPAIAEEYHVSQRHDESGSVFRPHRLVHEEIMVAK